MRKKIDPRLIALKDAEGKALADFERWKRAWHRMDKARARLASIKRSMRRLQAQRASGEAHKP